jgi:hypothetical protein
VGSGGVDDVRSPEALAQPAAQNNKPNTESLKNRIILMKSYINSAVLTVLATACAASVHAQFESSAPFDSTIMDAKINAEINPTEQYEKRYNIAFSEYKEAKEKNQKFVPIWKTLSASLPYSYTLKHSKGVDASNTDAHTITPNVLLETVSGISLRPGFLYSNSRTVDATGNRTSSDTWGPSLGIGYDLGKLTDLTNRLVVVIGGDIGYRQTTGSAKGAAQEADSVPLGVFVAARYDILPGDPDHGKRGLLRYTLTPTYRYERRHGTDIPSNVTTRTSGDLFAVQNRFDYLAAERLTVSLVATWNHDVHQSLPAGRTTNYQDWADLGGQISMALSKSIKGRVGYAYEAFNTAYYAHKATAAVDMTF